MKRTKSTLRFVICFLAIAQASVFPANSQIADSTVRLEHTHFTKANVTAFKLQRQITIKLFFTNPNHPDFATTCGAGEFVTRKIPATKSLATAALKQLFAGPTAEEKAKGMESLELLGRYYLGVSVRRGVAIVNFRPAAEKYLNATACQQEQRHTPIVKTLMQFSTIKSVEFAINGKIIEEWDA